MRDRHDDPSGHGPLPALEGVDERDSLRHFVGIDARAGEQPRRLIAPAWSLYALFWAIMAFWVLRNVPGFGFLGPGT